MSLKNAPTRLPEPRHAPSRHFAGSGAVSRLPSPFKTWLMLATVGIALCLIPSTAFSKDSGKDKAKVKAPVKTQKTEKSQPSKPLPPSDQVLAALKKTAESEPTIISGKIEKSLTLKGLVVITKDAELASDEVELAPSSGAIVVNNAPSVYYKPCRINGIPFVSISTNPEAGQKSHMHTSARYWASMAENCIFKGRFLYDPACTPNFVNCLFLASPLPHCGSCCSFPAGPSGAKAKYVNCLFQGFDIGPLVNLADIIARSETSGFKGIRFTSNPPPPPEEKKRAPNFPPDARYSFYDFDGVIAPAIPQLEIVYKGDLKLKFNALKADKTALPYYDKIGEVDTLLDEIALKYQDRGTEKQTAAEKQAAVADKGKNEMVTQENQ